MKILIIGDGLHERIIKEQLEDKDITSETVGYKGKKDIKGFIKFLFKVRSFDIVYRIWGDEFNPWLIVSKLFLKRNVVHWIGSDTFNLINKKTSKRRILFMQRFIDLNLSVCDLLHKELKSKGIESKIVPILPEYINDEMDNPPAKHAALVYIPNHKEKFYNMDLTIRLAKEFKDIKFYIVANDGINIEDTPENMIFLGRINEKKMDAIYKEISVLVRIPKHDGLPKMVLEALIKGKSIIYKYEFPYCYKADEFESCSRIFQSIISKPPIANVKGHDFVLAKYDKEATIMKTIDVLSTLI